MGRRSPLDSRGDRPYGASTGRGRGLRSPDGTDRRRTGRRDGGGGPRGSPPRRRSADRVPRGDALLTGTPTTGRAGRETDEPRGPRAAVPGAKDRTDRRSGIVRADARPRGRTGAAPERRPSSEGRGEGAEAGSTSPAEVDPPPGVSAAGPRGPGKAAPPGRHRPRSDAGRIDRPEAAPRGAVLPAAGALSGRAHSPRRPGGPARAPGAFARPGTERTAAPGSRFALRATPCDTARRGPTGPLARTAVGPTRLDPRGPRTWSDRCASES